MDIQLFAEEKREQPTQKRRQDARKRGQVARSGEIGILVTFVTGMVGLRLFGPGIVDALRKITVSLWSLPQEVTERSVRAMMLSVTFNTARAVFPIMGLLVVMAFVSDVAQVGLLMSGESVSMNLSRIDPFAGAARIFSKRSLVELLKSVFKVSIVGYCLWQIVRGIMPEIPGLATVPISSSVSWAGNVVWRMVIQCVLGLMVVAAGDYIFQWREHEQSIMMTRKELLDELKESEGRPEVRQQIKARQRQMASQRMMAAIKQADVVVTNPDHYAVALQYDAAKMNAPKVVAKGVDWMAERIKEEAARHSITLVENPPVARALYSSVEVGEAIPPSLYQAVAEILAFVYKLKADTRAAGS